MNVDYWSRQPEYSFVEAAFLCCGMEPMRESVTSNGVSLPKDAPQAVVSMGRRLIAEVPHRSTTIKRATSRALGTSLNVGSWVDTAKETKTITTNRFFKREDLLQWAEENGLRPIFLFPSEEQIKPADSDLPYMTPEMIAMFAAIREFWTDYDKSRPPKQYIIVEWLKTEHELSEHQAKAIDRIIRPEQYRKGGNR